MLARREVEGFAKVAERVEKECFSSRETVLEDGNAKADARLVGLEDATA